MTHPAISTNNMTTIDLITGFLGSGKTTFLKRYLRFLLAKGERICVLEFDYGAVNVDAMLLQEFEGLVDLEMVSGACDQDCHLRRFKTKLIAMGMKKYDRVIVEPSGIFDPDEFFDALAEDPLSDWYRIGSVMTIVDSGIQHNLSEESRYILMSQIACSGAVIFSKTDINNETKLNGSIDYVKSVVSSYGITMPPHIVDGQTVDFQALLATSFREQPHVKKMVVDQNEYRSLYFLNPSLSIATLKSISEKVFQSKEFGGVLRIKGYVFEDGSWFEINLTKDEQSIAKTTCGQDVILLIGEQIDEKAINSLFESAKNH